MMKILNLKLVILLEYQDKKIVCKKLQYKFLVIKNVKNTVPWIYVISDLKGKRNCCDVLRLKNCKKQIKNSLELKK